MFRELLTLRLISLLVIFLLKPTLSSNISPDSKRLYHDIVSGHGLYYGFTKLTELGGDNFHKIVFKEQNNKYWCVEFYNSWCGHCHKFAPTWKALASDVFAWKSIVGIGAVDCANDANNQLCRDMEIMHYPMMKCYKPESDEKNLGEELQKGTVGEMRKDIVIGLKSLDSIKSVTNVKLKTITETNLDSIWSNENPVLSFILLIFGPEDSIAAAEVALDVSEVKEVSIKLVDASNEQLAQIVKVEPGSNAVVAVTRALHTTKLPDHEHTRVGLNKVIRRFLIDQGINVSQELSANEVIVPPEVNIGDVMNVMQIEDEIKKKLHTTALSSIVFQLDLEGAIRYSLKNEVPLHKNISGDNLTALKNFMTVLINYFPFGQQGVDFLKNLKEKTLDNKNEVSGKNFRQMFLHLEDEFKPFLPKQGWIGCRGSLPEFRGYPCSLWTLFHTLTVHEELRDKNTTDDKPDVIHAMAGYVKNFFTCSECAAHFTEMAKTISGNVTNQNDSIMWLWAAHNKVNNRLAGDQTEDPQHKKIQFPSSEVCPSCHAEDGSWNKSEVLLFLKNMYSNIVYLQEEDLTTSSTTTSTAPTPIGRFDRSLRHKIFGDDQGYKHQGLDDGTKRSSWDFNQFDISLCVVLYVCSVAILILVCIKFVFKRSYRKKPYIHDILNKV